MKLEGVYDDAVYLSQQRDVYVQTPSGDIDFRGTIPNPHSGISKLKYEVKTGGIGRFLREPITGKIHSVTIWPVSAECIFANAVNCLFRSDDGGRSWQLVKTLHEASGIRGIMPRGFCYHDGTVYFGEYILDDQARPRVLASDDFGESWYTVVTCPDVRHIHSLQVDPYTDELWITTGDRAEESIIGTVVDDEIEVVGTGSQLWRAVQLLFLPDSILWGTDSPYQDNHIIRLPRSEIGMDEPAIEKLHTLNNPFFYATAVDGWAVVSTSASPCEDSTAPDGVTYDTDRFASVLTASQESDYSDWIRVATFPLGKNLSRLIGLGTFAASSYIFLEGNDTQGLFINPFNTSRQDGRVFRIPPEELRQ